MNVNDQDLQYLVKRFGPGQTSHKSLDSVSKLTRSNNSGLLKIQKVDLVDWSQVKRLTNLDCGPRRQCVPQIL